MTSIQLYTVRLYSVPSPSGPIHIMIFLEGGTAAWVICQCSAGGGHRVAAEQQGTDRQSQSLQSRRILLIPSELADACSYCCCSCPLR
jgi:hypothetical protein